MKKPFITKKPYITKKHLLVELLGLLCIITAIIVVFVIIAMHDGKIPSKYNDAGEVIKYSNGLTLLIFPITMFFPNLFLALVMHFLPASSWNVPFKVNPEKAQLVYSDTAMLLALIEFELGVYVLIFTALFNAKDGFKLLATLMLVIALVVTWVAMFRKAAIHNR